MITLIVGPMFAGKTTCLMADMRELQRRGLKCLLVRFDMDDRAPDGCVFTHDKTINCSNYTMITAHLLTEVQVADFDVVAVLEGQFFEDLEISALWASAGKTVLVEALIASHQRIMFDPVTRLMPKVDRVRYLRAKCACCRTGAHAPFTVRADNANTDEVIRVGGNLLYTPMCRLCADKAQKYR